MTSIEDSRIPTDLLLDDPAAECPGAAPPRISVVVPTLNESRNIGWVLARLPRDLHEVILVDGCSVDGTVAAAEKARPGIRVLVQPLRGKGAALAVGLAAATGDIAVVMDADGSMDPVEIPGFVGALLSGADVVKGSRAAAGGGSNDLSMVRLLGNRALTFAANRIYRQSWRELCYGYAAFWVDVLPSLDVPGLAALPGRDSGVVHGHGFEIEAVLFCRAARADLRVAEVFSFEHERRSGASHLSTWRDGVRVLRALVRERCYRSPVPVPPRRSRPPVSPGWSVQVPSARIGGLA